MERHDRRLDAAVQLGIITAEQATAIRAIAPHRDDRPARVPVAVDAAVVGYVLGAITVIAAMIWFLVDRWEWLGPGGALAVSLLYGLLLVITSERLRAEGYALAGGLAMLLAVATVPPATIALNALTGWFVELRAGCAPADFDFLACRGEELVVELVTVAAGLLGLRRARFAMLVLPAAAFGVRAVFMIADLFGMSEPGMHAQGWLWGIGASVVLAGAYRLERAQDEELDLAFWVHAIAFLCAIPATMQVVGVDGVSRHLLPFVAFVAFAVALLLRRAVWLLYGMGCFTGYVIWLAAEQFRDTPAFPIVLAALGIAVIIATVWVQRNAARLAARFGVVRQDGRPRFPGGTLLLLLPALVFALMIPEARREDAEAKVARELAARRSRRQAADRAAERAAASAPRAPVARPEETTPPAKP